MSTYIAIDLKSFYASVECAERGLDPLKTNLVVADLSRTEKTICLAVSPSFKAYGISSRARLFEVIQRVKEVNSERLAAAIKMKRVQKDENGQYKIAGASYEDPVLKADPSMELKYITAPPRMKLYEEYSTKIYSIYLKHIAPEDIHVYSIDEVFIDVTKYMAIYNMTAHDLAMAMAGVVAAAPVLALILRPIIAPVYTLVGADTSMFATTLLACDMGGYPLAMQLAADEVVTGRAAVQQADFLSLS